MKTQTNHRHFVVWSLLVGFALVGAVPATIYAETQVSNPGSGPDIFLAWSLPADPDPLNDFTVDFTNPANPDVQLKTGDTTWNVRSQLGANPGNIGNVTLDPTVSTANFDLTMANGANPGAANVASINMTAAGWAGHSSLGNGTLAGNLTGDLKLVKDAAGAGGEITGTFTIGGNASGNITVPSIPVNSILKIVGDASGDIEVEALGDGELLVGILRIDGNLSGDIRVTQAMNRGSLVVFGSVTSAATITIEDMVNSALATFSSEFGGNLVLVNGIPDNGNVIISGELTATGLIDLMNHDIAGDLSLGGGGSGTIINGGAVTATGNVSLASGSTETFAGIAAFSSVEPGPFGTGSIRLRLGASLAGKIADSGDVRGAINVDLGDLLLGALITVGGSVSGDIDVFGDAGGDISVAGDVTGAVTINGALESTGRILIDGLCDGSIAIGRQTDALSLIRMTEGLGVNGSITVNDSGGDFDAGGTIHVGATKTVPPIVFDGSILIKKESGGPGGGDLNGKIIVRGCHATDDDLDICICGTNNGTVTLIQTGCPPLPTLVGWSCVSGCP